MRVLVTLVFIAGSSLAQIPLDPAKMPAAIKAFERQPDERTLSCWVQPLKPYLSFAFRFQAGYIIHVPLKQFSGPGHSWGVITRIAPAGGQPLYLASGAKLPELPRTKAIGSLAGGYVLGAGRYNIDLMLFDETGRICRSHWRTEARLGKHESKVRLRIAPNTAGTLFVRRRPASAAPPPDLRPFRVTILLHAAPAAAYLFSRQAVQLRAGDRLRLLGSLAALQESLPGASIRLVAFNLDQQKELFQCEDCGPDMVEQVGQSLNQLELAMVNYHVLENRRGHLDLLAGLIHRELTRAAPSDVVVFLGPPARHTEKVPALEEPRAAAPQFSYFQYRLYWDRGADFADSIEHAVAKLRGKTIRIRTAGEFAAAIEELRNRR